MVEVPGAKSRGLLADSSVGDASEDDGGVVQGINVLYFLRNLNDVAEIDLLVLLVAALVHSEILRRNYLSSFFLLLP